MSGSRPESPHSYSGDYYRDTNAMNKSASRSQISHSNQSIHQQPQPAMSQYGAGFPALPMMPFQHTGFGGSAAGSEYGGMAPPMQMPMQMQGTGSMYGMMPPGAMMSGFAPPMFPAASNHSATGSMGGPFQGAAAGNRPMSTLSFATNVNPFAAPSDSENPTDEELVQALRNYLSTQDLMTVTKKYVDLRPSIRCNADLHGVGRPARPSWRASRRRTSLRGRRS